MGEEEKKPAEQKKPAAEESKSEGALKAEKPAEDGKKEEKKSEESKAAPPPPQEIVLRVLMHCEGCARKVHRCLKGFQGVEEVITDCSTSTVVVKGEKADPVKVLERVQRKSHRHVQLISPIPKPPAEEPLKPQEKEVVKPEEKKEEPPVISVVLAVYMHCAPCAQEIKRRIQRMKGVESAEPDLKSSEVIVKGAFQPEKLCEYVYKRTGKHATIIKVEMEEKEEEKGKEGKEEKKAEGEKDAKKGDQEADKVNKEGGDNAGGGGGGGGDPPAEPEVEWEVEDPRLELRRNEFYYYYPQNYQLYPLGFVQEMNYYPPQMFSDENPNACSVV